MPDFAPLQPIEAVKAVDLAAFHRFARSLNLKAFAFAADPAGALIISRLISAEQADVQICVRELTHTADFSTTAMLRRLQQFENDGVIHRARDKADGRSKLVTITPAGRAHIAVAASELGSLAP